MEAMKHQLNGILRSIESRGVSHLKALGVKNITAFSGGVDSSLATALVYQVFPQNSVACIGISPSLSQTQLLQARQVADSIGITLWEHQTSEGKHEKYIENKGQSCYFCKTNLYTMLNEVAEFSLTQLDKQEDQIESNNHAKPVIYNGTNADDKLDPTRLGLIAASEFQVVSPLETLTKQEVRDIAKYMGLPNWNYAASPCLRSRLEFGIEATENHLKRVEAAEEFIRGVMDLAPHENMRVRFLAGNRAAIELDHDALEKALKWNRSIEEKLVRIGFTAVTMRPFKSGSVSGYTANL